MQVANLPAAPSSPMDKTVQLSIAILSLRVLRRCACAYGTQNLKFRVRVELKMIGTVGLWAQ
jgi:hypothetical protein